jgi:hypothetical protein
MRIQETIREGSYASLRGVPRTQNIPFDCDILVFYEERMAAASQLDNDSFPVYEGTSISHFLSPVR